MEADSGSRRHERLAVGHGWADGVREESAAAGSFVKNGQAKLDHIRYLSRKFLDQVPGVESAAGLGVPSISRPEALLGPPTKIALPDSVYVFPGSAVLGVEHVTYSSCQKSKIGIYAMRPK